MKLQKMQQKLDKIDMSEDKWAVRYHLQGCVIINWLVMLCKIKFFSFAII